MNLRHLTATERFHARYIPEPNSGCWLWEAACQPEGYGHMYWHGQVVQAHRISWLVHFGEIPKDTLVCHKCDIRLCVNPAHLFLGTHADNLGDMAKKGRSIKGRRFTTHCPQGHEYTPENSYSPPTGGRTCRTCRKEREAANIDAKREYGRRYMRERRAKARLERLRAA